MPVRCSGRGAHSPLHHARSTQNTPSTTTVSAETQALYDHCRFRVAYRTLMRDFYASSLVDMIVLDRKYKTTQEIPLTENEAGLDHIADGVASKVYVSELEGCGLRSREAGDVPIVSRRSRLALARPDPVLDEALSMLAARDRHEGTLAEQSGEFLRVHHNEMHAIQTLLGCSANRFEDWEMEGFCREAEGEMAENTGCEGVNKKDEEMEG
ncbi:hypothetical protein EJ05DRAFT_499949 [Pseudovirgaria hyperparasitica]|uniref:Uncharacterized protein n=1 Tax=Pseudovirgaria hyperparasitica TaxID=470096 RepID=A0A6A6W958_9PEZI|nr:uncharacterized protein EJ05DRAFT_499949 [Pseudovirgaria hyperparasitica]KAF2758426.1 hypothetical protein EJ05DRAFT_499949 [Pseudovirgaria hyperparasitica]